jgi:hypothetical protein
MLHRHGQWAGVISGGAGVLRPRAVPDAAWPAGVAHGEGAILDLAVATISK